jgi:hypothetical protein
VVTSVTEEPLPPPEPVEKTSRRVSFFSRRELIECAVLIAGFVVIGAVLGAIWLQWSPPRPRAYILGPGAVLPDESESFISTDARFVILTGAAGVVVAMATWFRRSLRGPAAVLALGLGGAAGSLTCLLVGRLFGGGQAEGPAHTVVLSPLTVHASQFIGFQAFVAVAVYASAVLLCERNDLGRDEDLADEDAETLETV